MTLIIDILLGKINCIKQLLIDNVARDRLELPILDIVDVPEYGGSC